MKKKLFAMQKLDFPSEIITGFYIEIFSKKELVVTGDIAVEELSEENIHLKCGKNHFSVNGTKLKIISYSVNGIRINGSIEKIEFL